MVYDDKDISPADRLCAWDELYLFNVILKIVITIIVIFYVMS